MSTIVGRAQEYGRFISDQVFTPVALTSLTVPDAAVSALITVTGATARYRFGASNPTAATGHLVNDGGNIEVFENDMRSITFLDSSGTSTVFVSYFGE